MQNKDLSEKAVVIFSGGQDSTTCLFWAFKKYGQKNVEAITFIYGQKHEIEIDQSRKICEKYSVKQTLIDMSFLKTVADSALLNNGDVNEIKSNGLPASFVPNRNQLFITIAHAYAQKIQAENLITGVCQTDYNGFSDCRIQFIKALEKATNYGAFGHDEPGIEIHTPLMFLTKAETFKLAQEVEALDAVINESHTCYNGNRTKFNSYGFGCDNCPACELRKQGYNEAIEKKWITKK